MFERFDEIFRSCGWRVVELRYGKRLEAALAANPKLKSWFEQLSNAELSALHYQGGAVWRSRIENAVGKSAAGFLKQHDDAALASLFTDLGGHCMESLVEAFDAAEDDVPTLFIAWTIKGYGLPFAGHKDNHAGLMNPTQMTAWREAMGVREGHEWDPLESVGDNARPGAEAVLERSRIAREKSAAASAPSRSRRSPRRPATNSRPRPPSAGSCSTCPRREAICRIAS
jgi:pyruvate dehydrogenase E1 component